MSFADQIEAEFSKTHGKYVKNEGAIFEKLDAMIALLSSQQAHDAGAELKAFGSEIIELNKEVFSATTKFQKWTSNQKMLKIDLGKSTSCFVTRRRVEPKCLVQETRADE